MRMGSTHGIADVNVWLQASTQNPEMAAKYAALKDDPELKVGAPAYSCPSPRRCLVICKDLYTSASHVLLIMLCPSSSLAACF
jgi:hypothetical protein